MRKLVVIIGCSVFLLTSTGYSQETFEKAQEMAAKIHKIVQTDVIYTNQEIKALYYQNIQIIRLLEDIKELLAKNFEAEKEK